MIAVFAVTATAWLTLGYIAAGWNFAYFQREYPDIADKYRQADFREAMFSLALGLIAFIATLTTGFYKHGWLSPTRKSDREVVLTFITDFTVFGTSADAISSRTRLLPGAVSRALASLIQSGEVECTRVGDTAFYSLRSPQ